MRKLLVVATLSTPFALGLFAALPWSSGCTGKPAANPANSASVSASTAMPASEAGPAMTTVDAIVKNVPADRRADFEAVRKVVNDNLPPGYVETVGFGMLAWVIPRARYPETYNGQPLMLASLAAQKNYSSLYLLGIYGAEDGRAWFEREWKKSGKKLDMGKSCIRFKKADDLPLDAIRDEIASATPDQFIEIYEAARRSRDC